MKRNLPIRLRVSLCLLTLGALAMAVWFIYYPLPSALSTPQLLITTDTIASSTLAPEQSSFVELFTTTTYKERTENMSWDTTDAQLSLALQDNLGQQNPQIVTNGQTLYVVWHDLRRDRGDIYAQQIDLDGNRLWAQDVRINSDTGNTLQMAPTAAVASDGTLWVAWVDNRDDNRQIYAQRITPLGTTIWASDVQVSVSAMAADAGAPAIAIGFGQKATIVWHDNRSGDYDVYAQQISANGLPTWSANRRVNNDSSGQSQTDPSVTVHSGGTISIAWLDQRGGNGDIYAQRFSGDGSPLWPAEIRINPTAIFGVKKPVLAAIGADTIIAWIDSAGKLYAQRLDSNGAPQWVESRAINHFSQPAATDTYPAVQVAMEQSVVFAWKRQSDGALVGHRVNANGANQWSSERQLGSGASRLSTAFPGPTIALAAEYIFLAWSDVRTDSNGNIVAQKVTSTPELVWPNEVLINDVSGTVSQQVPAIAALGDDIVVAWQDWRNSAPAFFLQRFSAQGQRLWSNAVRLLEDDFSDQDLPVVDLATNDETIYAVWADARTGRSQVYLQLLNADGNRLLANPFAIHVDEKSTIPQYNPKVAVDAAGNIYVVWEEQYDGGYRVVGKQFDARLTPQSYGSFNNGRLPNIAVNAQGRIQLIWLSVAGSDIELYTSSLTNFLDPGTAPRVLVNHLEGRVDRYNPPDLAIDDISGHATIVWVDSIESGVYVQRFHGITPLWTANVQLNATPGTFTAAPALTLHSNGESTVVWQDILAGNRLLAAQRLDTQGQPLWQTDTERYRVVSSAAQQAQHPAVATTATGNIWVAWQEFRAMNDDVYLQQLDARGTPILGQDLQVPQVDRFYHSQGQAQAKAINGTQSNVAAATLTAAMKLQGGTAEFWLSNNGGESWDAISPGIRHHFAQSGSDLRWRAQLQGNPFQSTQTPSIQRIQVDYAASVGPGGDDVDAYEPDNGCDEAQPIQPSGLPQQHTLQVDDNGTDTKSVDSDWLALETAAGTAYTVLIQQAERDWELRAAIYGDCNATTPTVTAAPHALGAMLTFTSTQTGSYYLYIGGTDALTSSATYNVDVRRRGTQALAILAVGRLAAGDSAQAQLDRAADNAYQVLLASGYSADQITYLRTEDGPANGNQESAIDEPLTVASLQNAITVWARTVSTETGTLLIYLLGQGASGAIKLDNAELGNNQSVDVATLDLWLSNLQNHTALEQIGVILEMNFAGSMLTGVPTAEQGGTSIQPHILGETSLAGPRRTIIASTQADGWAWPSPQGMIFSDSFWWALAEGASIREAFLGAQSQVEALNYRCGASQRRCQLPQYDDNGNGIPNEVGDGNLGAQWGLPAPNAGVNRPYIRQIQTTVMEEADAEANKDVQLAVVAEQVSLTAQAEVHLIATGRMTVPVDTSLLPTYTHTIVPLLPNPARHRYELTNAQGPAEVEATIFGGRFVVPQQETDYTLAVYLRDELIWPLKPSIVQLDLGLPTSYSLYLPVISSLVE